MKVTTKPSTKPNLLIEVEGDTEVEIFKALSRVEELLNHGVCGKCESKDTKFVWRKDSDDNDWLEMSCNNPRCNARLPFGQQKGKGGTIYAKKTWRSLSETQKAERADEEEYANKHGGWLPNGGWFIFKKKKS